MNKFFGTGEFQCRGDTRKAHLCLNLDENVIEVWHEQLLAAFDWLKSKAVLSHIHFHLPTGKIVKELCDDCVVTGIGPAHDSTVAKAMGIRSEEAGMTKVVLKPRHPIEFSLSRSNQQRPNMNFSTKARSSAWTGRIVCSLARTKPL